MKVYQIIQKDINENILHITSKVYATSSGADENCKSYNEMNTEPDTFWVVRPALLVGD